LDNFNHLPANDAYAQEANFVYVLLLLLL